MKTFSFLTNLTTINQVKRLWAVTQFAPDLIIRPFLKITPAFKIYRIKNIRSDLGIEIGGFIFVSTLLPNQIKGLNDEEISQKFTDAIELSRKLGVNIIGFGGSFSECFQPLAQKTRFPVATGVYFTAWTVIESVYRMARVRNLRLDRASVALIGAFTPMEHLCAMKLSQYVSKISFTASNSGHLVLIDKDINTKFENLKQKIHSLNDECNHSVEINMEQDISKAVSDADIIIITGNQHAGLINLDGLKSGAIVCDVNGTCSLKNRRTDLVFISGGLVKPPCPVNLPFDTELPEGIIPAALAEILLLTFEEKFKNYSFGSKVDIDILEHMADISVRHGFEVFNPQAPVL